MARTMAKLGGILFIVLAFHANLGGWSSSIHGSFCSPHVQCARGCGRTPLRRSATGTLATPVPDLEAFGIIRRKRSIPMEVLGLVRLILFGLVLFGSASMIVVVMRAKLSSTKRKDPYKRAFMDRMNIIWAKASAALFFRVQVVNPENLPAQDDKKAYIYIGNHQSFMDILSLYFLNRSFKWVSKASIAKIPVIGWAMTMTGHVLLERDDRKSQMATIRNCIEKLKNGCSMFFFPEGTRTKTGRLLEFKKGAFSIARKSNVGMVPITILGTGDLMPAGREFRLFPGRPGVKLVVHPVISAEDVQRLSDNDLMAQAEATIRSALPPVLQSKE